MNDDSVQANAITFKYFVVFNVFSRQGSRQKFLALWDPLLLRNLFPEQYRRFAFHACVSGAVVEQLLFSP